MRPAHYVIAFGAFLLGTFFGMLSGFLSFTEQRPANVLLPHWLIVLGFMIVAFIYSLISLIREGIE